MSQIEPFTNYDHLKLAIYHLEQLSAPDPDCDDLTFLFWANIMNTIRWLELFFKWSKKKKK